MKITIDIRPLLEEKHTGVQEYLTGLLGQFLKLDNENEFILFYSGRKEIQNSKFKIQNYKAKVKIKYFQISNRTLNLSLKFSGYPYLDKLAGKTDVFFTPNINLAPVSKNCRKVITFHDLSFERHPEFFSIKRRLWHKFINPKKQAQTSDSIIAVSESTKADLVELYGIQPEKIKIIYSGINNKNQKLKIKNIQKKYKLPERFILYLGTIEPRKNIIGLIKAFELLKSKFLRNPPSSSSKKSWQALYKVRNGIKLVIAGSKGWLYKDVFKEAQKSKRAKDIIFTGFINQKDKQYLYKLSDLGTDR